MDSTQTAIDSELISAYLKTEYHIEWVPHLRLSIGVEHPALAELFAAFHIHSAAYVTACNPHSQRLDDEQNKERLARLETELKTRGLSFLPGNAIDPGGHWPDEPGFMVMGLSLESAKTLGRHYQQNALVWCGSTLVPELILLEG